MQSVADSSQRLAPSDISLNTPKDSALLSALLTKKSPDLALLVERWDGLPEAVRAGIVAMVKATGAGERPNDETTKRPKGRMR